MKKIVYVVALAAILLFAFSAAALAEGINHSGQTRLGAEGLGPATYLDWTLGLGTNAVSGSAVHGNYMTTTVKCVVCHSVHYAAPGGAPVSGGTWGNGSQQFDTLLRMRADQACAYCHSTLGEGLATAPVYDGVAAGYLSNWTVYTGSCASTLAINGGVYAGGHVTGENCSYCHTGVHGAGQDNSVEALDGKLLKQFTMNDVKSEGTALIGAGSVATLNGDKFYGGTLNAAGADTTNMLEAIAAVEHNAENQGFAPGQALGYTIGEFATLEDDGIIAQTAIGIFCAECHLGSYSQAAAGASANVLESDARTYTGHRIGADAIAHASWNTAPVVSSSSLTMQTAWKPSTVCISCHDATDTYDNPGFPHSWGNAKMWLTSGANAGSTTTTVPLGCDTYSTTKPQLADGVCLKCHVSPDGTAGVGVTY